MFKHRNSGRKTLIIALLLVVLTVSVLASSLLVPGGKVSAAQNAFTYEDAQNQKINGPVDVGGAIVVLTFDRVSEGAYLEGYNGCTYTIETNNNRDGGLAAKLRNTCRADGGKDITIKAFTPGGGGPGGTDPGDCDVSTGECPGDANATCETRINNPLSWMLCPVFNGVADMSDWLYAQFIVPFLKAAPISTENTATNVSFKVWSGFRLYGNIILIIAMLVMVFGQAIGGGVVDAYTIKKVMPRILIAAILINLSIYIMAFMTDLTNIAGKGLQQVIWAPLKAAGAGQFDLNLVESFGSVGLAMLGTFFGAAGLSGILLGLLTGKGIFISKAMIYILFAVLIPVVLAIIGVFATLIIRRGLLIFLVISSPVAFALYALPNTEQYFRKWWNLFIRTLLVYPIVVLIFAIADVLTVTILLSNNIGGLAGSANGVIVAATAFVIQFLPLAMVPFAFRMSGGVMGAVFNGIKGGLGRVNDMAKSRREQAAYDYKTQTLEARDKGYRKLQGIAGQYSKGKGPLKGRATRFGAAFLASRVGGHNLEEAIATRRQETQQRMELQNAIGDDTQERALTVNKEYALDEANGAFTDAIDDQGRKYRTNGHAKIFEDGHTEFKTLGGAWVNEADVDAAHERWGGDQYALQWSVGHEMDKAASEEEQQYLKDNFKRLTGPDGGFNMNDTQAKGVWKGAGFQKQNVNRSWKHMGWDAASGDIKMDSSAMLKEVDEKQMAGQLLSQSGDFWETMEKEVKNAGRVIETGGTHELPQPPGTSAADYAQMRSSAVSAAHEVLDRASRVAFSMRSAAFVDTAGEGGDAAAPATARPAGGTAPAAPPPPAVAAGGTVTIAAGAATGAGGRAAGSGASARSQEAIRNFLSTTDRVAGPYTLPATPGGPSRVPPGAPRTGAPPPPTVIYSPPAPTTPERTVDVEPGPRIIRPGDDDFTIPPGSRPPGR